MSPYTYAGFQVIFVNDSVVTVDRSWKERLFTRPWTPWVRTKTEVHQHAIRPGKAALILGRLYIHEVDKVNFLIRMEAESLSPVKKERADKGEEAPLLVDPLSPPRNAGFEPYTATIPYQESAIKFGTATGRLPSKRDLLMQYQDFKFTPKAKVNGDDDDEPPVS